MNWARELGTLMFVTLMFFLLLSVTSYIDDAMTAAGLPKDNTEAFP